MPRSFVFDQPAYRVIFGVGSLDRLPDEVTRLMTDFFRSTKLN